MIILSIDQLESCIPDERERPRDYKNHTYPCMVEYEESWDAHFCGYYYFVYDPNNEKLIQAFRDEKECTERLIHNQQKALKIIDKWLKTLDK